MTFGSDFFKVFAFVIAIIRLIARTFGEAADKDLDDKFGSNHLHQVDKDVHDLAP